MFFLIVGIVAFALKLAGIGPLATLHWWWFSVPFALAIVWWQASDMLGLTEKLAMRRLLQRRRRRQEEAMLALGMKPGQVRRMGAARARAEAAPEGAEADEKARGEARGSEARAERKIR